MTLSRRLYRSTRPLVLASVAGATFCSLTFTVQAQQPSQLQQVHPSSGTTLTPAGSAPVLLPAPSPAGLRPSTKPLVTPSQPQLAPMPIIRSQQSANAAATEKHNSDRNEHVQLVQYEPGLLDRVRGAFRSAPTTSPVDPGMSYPKAPKNAPPQKPATAQRKPAGIPLVPPALDDAPPTIPPAGQPGLLPSTAGANPIHDMIPPAPSGSVPPAPVMIQAQSTNAAVVKSVLIPPEPTADARQQPNSPTVRNVAELKEFMQPQSKVVAVPPPPAASEPANLPQFNVNTPLTAQPKAIAPGEPTEQRKPEFKAPPPAPGVEIPMLAEATEKKSADPFADLFPGDSKTTTPAPMTAATPAPVAAPVAAPAVDSKTPYTGLTLENEPVTEPKKTVEVVPPPPLEVAARQTDAAPAMAPEIPKLNLEPTVPELSPPQLAPVEPQTPNFSLTEEPAKLPSVGAEMEMKIQPAPVKTASVPSVENEQKSKFERIAARVNQTGLKGFCPVVLRDERELVDSVEEFSMIYNGRKYEFSSEEALQKFAYEPLKYAPANACSDVIHLSLTGERKEGSLDQAVWYKGRLYLFSSVETMETFVAAPSSHASNE